MARILMTTEAVNGVWRTSLELAAALAAEGVDTVLAVLGPAASPRQLGRAGRVGGVRIEQGDFPLEWMDGVESRLEAAGEWLLGLAGRHCPDLVHVHGFAHAALPWGRPVVCSAHWDLLAWWRAVYPGEEPPREWRGYRERSTRGLTAADAVAVPSLHVLRELLTVYGPVMNAAVIPPGRSPGGGPGVRPLAADGFKEPLILGAGPLWDEGKNLRTLAAAAPAVPWPVAIAGASRPPAGGPPVQLLGVLQLGALDDEQLADWMARAAVYALPARYEPAGLSVLEAALAGCALVLGDEPGLREVWNDAAVFVPADDANALAAALRRFAQDSTYRQALAQAATRRAGEYTPARMARAYLDLYREADRHHQRHPLPLRTAPLPKRRRYEEAYPVAARA